MVVIIIVKMVMAKVTYPVIAVSGLLAILVTTFFIN